MQAVSAPLALAITAAKAKLAAAMRFMKLYPEDGWTIAVEQTQWDGRKRVIEVPLRAHHPTLPAPDFKHVVRTGRAAG